MDTFAGVLAKIAALLATQLGDERRTESERAGARELLDVVERISNGAQTPSSREPLDRALALMLARAGEGWTVATLARAAGLSRAAFARQFRRRFGMSPMRYLADLRMREAARLLSETDATLALVAAEVGYESEFAFSRAFKRHSGEAPGVYRRKAQPARSLVTRAAA
jgi:AraC-like DNA-binding protein